MYFVFVSEVYYPFKSHVIHNLKKLKNNVFHATDMIGVNNIY